MNRRRESTPDNQIHINPNRPKTPNSVSVTPVPKNRVSPVSSVQEDTAYETITNGRVSETMVFNSREGTPQSRGYGSTAPNLTDLTPLLNDKGPATLEDSRSDDEEEIEQLPFFSADYLIQNKQHLLRQLKIFLLAVSTCLCTCVTTLLPTVVSSSNNTYCHPNMYLITNVEHETEWVTLSLGQTGVKEEIRLHHIPIGINSHSMAIAMKGPFNDKTNNGDEERRILVEVYSSNKNMTFFQNINETMLKNHEADTVIHYIDFTGYNDNANMSLKLDGEVTIGLANECIPLEFNYVFTTDSDRKEACAAVVLVLVYGLIIFDLIHRTLAAILGSLASIAVLSAFGMRPTLETVLSWLDVETLSLLFGMMIIVAIFSETGFFDYCALMAYKLAKGKVWSLITLLCVFSAVVSAFLDNVTTILLLTPVTIRLCEVLNLDPKKILIAEVLFSNIGGTATAIGDPPNVIIVADKDIMANDINFSNFTVHMFVGILFVSVVGYGLLRLTYRKMEDLENVDPVEITELNHEIEMWRRAALRIVAVSREENIMKAIFHQRVAELENKLVKERYKMRRKKHKNFKEMLKELEKKYKITDKVLLVKSGLVLLGVILSFFLHSFITEMHVGLGWIAIIGAIWLMVLADMHELETILHRVEWSTLIFFAALFSMMEALAELGLISWIGDQVKNVITGVNETEQLLVAILLIIWVSAIASSFIDNIPYTTAMVPVLIILKDSTSVPLMPMVLALAFGACLGGNGTLIGASANVVSAGIAEQHGYGFTFMDFFKVGFPMMIVTNIVATVYLIICHVAFKWH